MMLPKPVQNLIDEFSKLPGIGPKTAARLVFYLLKKPKGDVLAFGQAAIELMENIKYCSSCFSITDNDICEICLDSQRNHSILAVVEEPLDIVALEKSRAFDGLYHVLGGVISPIDGIGPENLRIAELLDKIANNPKIREVILATNPSLEGEATATYIRSKIEKNGRDIEITRIARGLPVGGDLEYADEVTLSRSLEGRKKYN
ncbi:recombination protein RecR [Candidatus Berkelbacteria bacterium CG08_land_8_20_14_0_20_39_8]|uniref:Recombination protein RecR n=1 Tax=Candidatus Berkelbacteria bacterium CG08_land_8_20_14_0_20_39_8 TaxID=1974511 RepID=A0A2M6YCD4_9BACT|nr:MAG: recombination protein RecR [Candidatus Berkelbacteria bacterium CG08_land_8_20_14_0_20_39_8]